jgi:Cystatin domain
VHFSTCKYPLSGAFEIQDAGGNPGESSGSPSNHAPATRTRRGTLTGAPATADINDPYIQEIAKFSVAEMDKGSNALYHRTIVRLIEAKKQVVAGSLVHLTYELGYSDCRKGSQHDPELCKLKEGSVRLQSSFELTFIKMYFVIGKGNLRSESLGQALAEGTLRNQLHLRPVSKENQEGISLRLSYLYL